ncbi:MAG: hypothetical protein ACR2K2_06065 [Mycobacteriales bacterium]
MSDVAGLRNDEPEPEGDGQALDEGQPGAADAVDAAPKARRRARRTALFPATTFSDALPLAEAIAHYGAGKPVRRLTLFQNLKKSPDSGPTRQLMINSSKYGLTKGNHATDFLELTEQGYVAVSEDTSCRARLQVRFELAVTSIEVFKNLYGSFVGNRLPAQNVLIDHVKEAGIPDEDAAACVETFTVNVKDLGLLQSVGGAERLFPIEAALEDLAEGTTAARTPGVRRSPSPTVHTPAPTASAGSDDNNFDTACFYITPIGDDASEARKHSDLFMGSLIEPSLEEFGLRLVRADAIAEAGLITAQIIEHIVRSKLVIVDLSFHNPNVFYELALRHAVRKPIVQLSRSQDRLPFDVGQFRTVVIDTSDVYTFVPRLDSIKAEIAGQIRKALDQSDEAENPLSIFYPAFWDHLPSR